MKQVIYHGAERVLYGKKGGAIVWPTRTQDLANEQRDRIKLDPIFTADIQTEGLRNYAERNPSGMIRDTDYGVCAAPDGSGDVVVWTDNSRHLSNGNQYQRSQLQTPQCIAPVAHTQYEWGNDNSVYVEYAKVWIEDKYPLGTTSQWINFFEPHGSPYIGSSAMGIMLVWSPTAGYHLRLGNDPNYLGTAVPFKLGQWVQLARQYKYEYAENGGWGDLWYNLSGDLTTGWVRAKINGGHRLPLDVIRKDANGNRTEGGGWVDSPAQLGGSSGMTHSKLGLYGNVYSVMYWADHRVGRTFKNTMPDGWSPAAFDGFDPDKLWAPAPEPTGPAYVAAPTNGEGGAMTNAKAVTFTASSLSSPYHREAAHLSGSGPHPLVIHLHGDGYEEYTQYNSGTANSTASKYAKVAVDNEALFILPRTPDTGNQTWWSMTSSTTWLVALIKDLKAKYNIDERRIFISGYSGGAEEVTYNLACDYHTLFKGGGSMLLGGGGAEGLTGFTGTPAADIKSDFLMRWWYGETDNGVLPSDTTIDAISASAEGEAWYKTRGFNTGRTMIPGVNHYTSEPYGPDLLRQLIDESNTRYGV